MSKKSARSKTDESAEDEYPESFEDGLNQTQQIVRQLESGSLSLEDSLKAYEVGVRRIRQCQEFLSDFQKRIELLTGFDKDGNPVTKPFDEEEMSLEEKQQARGKRRGAGPAKKKPDESDDSVLF